MKKQVQVITIALSVLLIKGAFADSPPPDTKSRESLPQAHSKTKLSLTITNQSQKSIATGASPLKLTPEEEKSFGAMMQADKDSGVLVKEADADVLLGNWSQAGLEYQQALNISPQNTSALYGMGQCAAAKGDLTHALSYYRGVIYTTEPGRYGTVQGDGFHENDIKRLMQFALLLNRAGQFTECLFVYNRAAGLMNYQGSKQVVRVLMPGLVMQNAQPGQVLYTSEHLIALADTAISDGEMGFGSIKEALAHMQEAAKLYPDSAVIQYYLGEALAGSYYHTIEHPAGDKLAMATAYQKAINLGDDETVAAAKERLSMYPKN